jgi:hypothetical protein
MPAKLRPAGEYLTKKNVNENPSRPYPRALYVQGVPELMGH